jgi:hypothetical protein
MVFILEFIAAAVAALIIWFVATATEPTSQNLKDAALNGDMTSINVVIFAAMVGGSLAVLFLLRKSYPPREYLALHPPRWKTLPLWLLSIAALSLGADQVLQFFQVDPTPEWMEQIYRNLSCRACLVLAVVVIAPVTEEVVFRGFVYAGMAARLGPAPAVVIAALPWAIMHGGQYDWPYLAIVFILGLLLGAARWSCGNLFVPIAMHMLNNLMATAVMWTGP